MTSLFTAGIVLVLLAAIAGYPDLSGSSEPEAKTNPRLEVRSTGAPRRLSRAPLSYDQPAAGGTEGPSPAAPML